MPDAEFKATIIRILAGLRKAEKTPGSFLVPHFTRVSDDLKVQANVVVHR